MGVYTQTVTFQNGQTADGGEVQTEIQALGNSVNNIVDAQISASAAITMTKLANFVAWTDYTPTWTTTGTAPSIGNGTLEGRYCRIGNVVFFHIYLDFGSTTSAGTGNWSFALPVSVGSNVNTLFPVSCYMRDTTGFGWGSTANRAGNTILPLYIDSSSHLVNVTATSPFTWTTGDDLHIAGSYEV